MEIQALGLEENKGSGIAAIQTNQSVSLFYRRGRWNYTIINPHLATVHKAIRKASSTHELSFLLDDCHYRSGRYKSSPDRLGVLESQKK
jgi:hypothetical protein